MIISFEREYSGNCIIDYVMNVLIIYRHFMTAHSNKIIIMEDCRHEKTQRLNKKIEHELRKCN